VAVGPPAAVLERESERLVRLAGPVRDLDVCDVGVRHGGRITRLRALGTGSVTGVDIAIPSLRALGDSGARLLVANAEILENLLNLGDTLVSADEALRRDSRVVRVPYHEDLQQFGQSRSAPHRFVHLRDFTRGLSRLMLEQAGFRIERMAFGGFLPNRLRPALRRHQRVQRPVREFLDVRYHTPVELSAIHVHLVRLMFRPNTLTAVARWECL
jgi:hypothetical protein